MPETNIVSVGIAVKNTQNSIESSPDTIWTEFDVSSKVSLGISITYHASGIERSYVFVKLKHSSFNHIFGFKSSGYVNVLFHKCTAIQYSQAHFEMKYVVMREISI